MCSDKIMRLHYYIILHVTVGLLKGHKNEISYCLHSMKQKPLCILPKNMLAPDVTHNSSVGIVHAKCRKIKVMKIKYKFLHIKCV